MQKVRILLTGCCGFIGSHLSEKLLGQGHEIVGVDNFDAFYDKTIKLKQLSFLRCYQSFHFYETDLRKAEFYAPIENMQFDVVIHLAAKVGVQPSITSVNEYVDGNILATTNLLNFMVERRIKKLLFTSSSSVYGNVTPIPFREDEVFNRPVSPYAATKLSCELMNFSYHHLHQIDMMNLRLFTVYGPRQRPDLAIHKFVKSISMGQSIKLYGDGSTARDYTFVFDIIEGYVAALDYLLTRQQVFEAVNLGNGEPVMLNELVSIIGTELGKKPIIEFVEEQLGDVKVTYADISKAQRLFGYEPKTKLHEGIKEFIKWYDESTG